MVVGKEPVITDVIERKAVNGLVLKSKHGRAALLSEGSRKARGILDVIVSDNVIKANRYYRRLSLEACRLPAGMDFFLTQAIRSLGLERNLSMTDIVAFGQDER